MYFFDDFLHKLGKNVVKTYYLLLWRFKIHIGKAKQLFAKYFTEFIYLKHSLGKNSQLIYGITKSLGIAVASHDGECGGPC